MSLKNLSDKCTSLIKFLYSNTRSQVRAYDGLLLGFMTRGAWQGWLQPSFLFNFDTKIAIEVALSSCENGGSDMKSSHLEYPDNVVLPNENPIKFQVFCDRLGDGEVVSGCFVVPKCEILLQDESILTELCSRVRTTECGRQMVAGPSNFTACRYPPKKDKSHQFTVLADDVNQDSYYMEIVLFTIKNR